MSIIVAIVAVIVIIVISIIFISVISIIIVIIVAHDSKRWERINYHWFEWMPPCLRADCYLIHVIIFLRLRNVVMVTAQEVRENGWLIIFGKVYNVKECLGRIP